MRHRYISYFAGIFLLAFFAVLNTGVLISVSGFQRLQNPVVSQPDFRRQPVSETMQVYLKQAADPDGTWDSTGWQQTLKTADFQEKSHPPDFRSCTANGETKRAGMLMCNHAGQSGMM